MAERGGVGSGGYRPTFQTSAAFQGLTQQIGKRKHKAQIRAPGTKRPRLASSSFLFLFLPRLCVCRRLRPFLPATPHPAPPAIPHPTSIQNIPVMAIPLQTHLVSVSVSDSDSVSVSASFSVCLPFSVFWGLGFRSGSGSGLALGFGQWILVLGFCLRLRFLGQVIELHGTTFEAVMPKWLFFALIGDFLKDIAAKKLFLFSIRN